MLTDAAGLVTGHQWIVGPAEHAGEISGPAMYGARQCLRAQLKTDLSC